MPTTVTNTIGATGSDYTTCALWEDGTDNTSLVTADEIRVGACKNETFSVAGNVVTIAGATTDATRYRHLTTDTGASFRDNVNVQTNALRANASNGALITSTGNYVAAVTIDENNCRVSKLQITNTTGGANGNALNCGSARSGLDIDGCILENGSTGLGAASFSAYTGKVRNTLLVSRGSGITTLHLIGSAVIDFINCTFVVPSDKTAATNCFGGNHGTITVKNCALFGITNTSTGTSSYTYTTCYTDDATPPTGATNAAMGNQFENTADATRDFRLKTGAGCIDTGTTDSTNAATDIAGTARPSGSAYDVGAWEKVQAGGVTLRRYTLMTLGVG